MKNSFFINRRPIAWLILIGIILMGTIAVTTIPIELQPEIKIPFGSVTTILPGANPEDVESLITEPLEKQIATISDINSLSSSSGLGMSTVVVEFEADQDIDLKIQEIKDKVDIAKIDFPEDASEPQVSKAEANSIAIISFSISGDRPLHELSKIAEILQDELENISGVSRIVVSGDQKKEIEVEVDPAKAKNFGLSLTQISNAIKYANHNFPIGTITSDSLNYTVRVDNRYEDIEDIKNIPLFTAQDENSTPIFLKDIAKIEEKYKEQGRIAKLSIGGTISQNSISLQLYKKDNSNLLDVVNAAKAKVEDLKNGEIPQDVEIAITADYSEFVEEDLGILTKSGIQTTALIIFILFLALGFKEGMLAGMVIPLSLLAGVAIIEAEGFSMNGLTVFSLVIALGLMVDTAIVIMEGIHENMRKGMEAKEAAIKSVTTYKWALAAGTFTTIFAFMPMLLVSGIMGQFLRVLPITISATLLSSLFISLYIIPSIAVKFLSGKDGKKPSSILQPIFDFVGKGFEKLIKTLVSRRIFRVLTIMITLLVFAGSMALPLTGILKTEMFPKTNMNLFMINIETPNGLVLKETEKIVGEVEAKLYDDPLIDNFLTIIGNSQGQIATDLISFGGASDTNLANITINLIDKEDRNETSYEISEKYREKFETFTKAKVTVKELSEGPPSDAPVTLRLTGDKIGTLRDIAKDVEEIIATIPGTQNITTTVSSGLNEFKFTLDRDKLSYHGLSEMAVSSEIRNFIQGINSTEVSLGEGDLGIIVKYDVDLESSLPKISIKSIENIEIPTPKGYGITLGDIGVYELTEGISSISHEDRKRMIKVRSDLAVNANPVDITKKIRDKLEDYEIPNGYNVEFGGDTEDIEESFRDLFQSMIVGIILIAFTLVLMFNSLSQPFIILLTLPMALIGVFPGLMAVGLALSFPAFLGVVALVGVVVNDAIVLIDRINNSRKEGEEFSHAIAEAANARLQPIMMTTITTVAGILPLALTNEFWAGLGFSLIFGLIAATFLTLIVVPVLYYSFEIRKAGKEAEV